MVKTATSNPKQGQAPAEERSYVPTQLPEKVQANLKIAESKLREMSTQVQPMVDNVTGRLKEASTRVEPMVRNATTTLRNSTEKVQPMLRDASTKLRNASETVQPYIRFSTLSLILEGYFTALEFAVAALDSVITMVVVTAYYLLVENPLTHAGWSVLRNMRPYLGIPLSSAKRSDPVAVHGNDVTPSTFISKYVQPQTAAVLMGGCDSWNLQKWTFETVEEAVGGDVPVTMQGAYFDAMQTKKESAKPAAPAGAEGIKGESRVPLHEAVAAIKKSASASTPLPSDGDGDLSDVPYVRYDVPSTFLGHAAVHARQFDVAGEAPAVILQRLGLWAAVAAGAVAAAVFGAPVAAVCAAAVHLRAQSGGAASVKDYKQIESGDGNALARLVTRLTPSPAGSPGAITRMPYTAAAFTSPRLRKLWNTPGWYPTTTSSFVPCTPFASLASGLIDRLDGQMRGILSARAIPSFDRVVRGVDVQDAMPYDWGLYMSSRGAVTRLHVDGSRSHAVLCQLKGVKRGILLPPKALWRLRRTYGAGNEQISLLSKVAWPRSAEALAGSESGHKGTSSTALTKAKAKPDASKDVKEAIESGWVFELRPGDVAFIPAHYPHEVETVTPSITMTWNFLFGASQLAAAATQWVLDGKLTAVDVRRMKEPKAVTSGSKGANASATAAKGSAPRGAQRGVVGSEAGAVA